MTLWLATLLTMACTAMNFTISVFMAIYRYNDSAVIFLAGTVLTLGILGCLACLRDRKTQLRVVPPYPVFASGVPEQGSRTRL